jgi:DNA-directed RNA polymerase subunit D
VKLISTEKEIGAIKTVARQKIDLDAIARWGRGEEHAKWQPVTICGYKNISDEDVNNLLFTVESDGALPVDEIILEAAKIMQEKCERMVEALKELS